MSQFSSGRRYRRDWRVAAAAVAAVAAVGGAASVAPHLTGHGAAGHVRQVAFAPPGGGGGGSYNGSVSDNGQGATVYDYPGTGNPDTSLASLGTLADNTGVTIQCYWTGAAVTGPNAQGGGTDDFWDQIIGASTGLPGPQQSLSTGHTYVVPDAYIDTSPKTVDQLVQPCTAPPPQAPGGGPGSGGTGSLGAGSGSAGQPAHDPGVPGPGGKRDGLPVLVATQVGSSNPFTVGGPDGTSCFVGDIPVECSGLNPLNEAPEGFLPAIAKYAKAAGVDPRLMLMILWTEDAHAHFADDLLANLDSALGNTAGNSLGLADMKMQPFIQVQSAHHELFGNHTWEELKTNDDLAIQTLAYKLADIEGIRTSDQTNADWAAAQSNGDVLPATWTNTSYRRDDVAALAYNSGATAAVSFVDQDQSWLTQIGNFFTKGATQRNLVVYQNEFNLNWSHADGLFCGSGAFTCTG